MKQINGFSEAFERYKESSVELFMEYYAQTVCVEPTADSSEKEAASLRKKCFGLINAAHRRKKLMAFIKESGRVLKSAAVLAIAILSLSSVLFVTVEAVRNPIMDFYIKQNDGNWQLSRDPYGTASQKGDIKGSFNEQDPLGDLISDDFYLHSVDGTLEDGLMAIYYNDNHNVISLQSTHSNETKYINTENASVERLTIDEYDAVLSVRKDGNSVISWYNSDQEIFLTITTDYFTKDEVVAIAQVVNQQLLH